ncbi:hypothetical protein PtB15_17B16 [Puccinia triticina]|nr:hypothetical protein PtB15_17B16 [Puccinia triticina]
MVEIFNKVENKIYLQKDFNHLNDILAAQPTLRILKDHPLVPPESPRYFVDVDTAITQLTKNLDWEIRAAYQTLQSPSAGGLLRR